MVTQLRDSAAATDGRHIDLILRRGGRLPGRAEPPWTGSADPAAGVATSSCPTRGDRRGPHSAAVPWTAARPSVTVPLLLASVAFGCGGSPGEPDAQTDSASCVPVVETQAEGTCDDEVDNDCAGL